MEPVLHIYVNLCRSCVIVAHAEQSPPFPADRAQLWDGNADGFPRNNGNPSRRQLAARAINDANTPSSLADFPAHFRRQWHPNVDRRLRSVGGAERSFARTKKYDSGALSGMRE
jgi:hypothetical protein